MAYSIHHALGLIYCSLRFCLHFNINGIRFDYDVMKTSKRRSTLCRIVLYFEIFYCVVSNVLYYIILLCFVLYPTVLYFIVSYHIMLCIVLYCIVLYCIILYGMVWYDIWYCIVSYCIVL